MVQTPTQMMMTSHCTHPITDIAGSGYDDTPNSQSQLPPLFQDPIYGNTPPGSTGWLTTTAPVSPGEQVKLHFIIFDEGDHVLDSSALIDNFQWGTQTVGTPTTIPIQ
jgi:hypothetical protein